MNVQPTNPTSAALPGVDARGEPPGWLSSQSTHVVEHSASFSRGMPMATDVSNDADGAMTPGEDTAVILRSRLLQMIVANEQSRKSQSAASISGE